LIYADPARIALVARGDAAAQTELRLVAALDHFVGAARRGVIEAGRGAACSLC
jgi:hypothetical protein